MKIKFLYQTFSKDYSNMLYHAYSLCLNGFILETKE